MSTQEMLALVNIIPDVLNAFSKGKSIPELAELYSCDELVIEQIIRCFMKLIERVLHDITEDANK